MIGMSEGQKVGYLDKIFRDADKSETSLIVIDAIERIIDYNPVGPRFSNSVVQTLVAFLTKPPPKGRHRLIIGTTGKQQFLSQLDMLENFSKHQPMPYVQNGEELANVLAGSGAFDDRAIRAIPKWIAEQTGTEKIGVGVKTILEAIGDAKQYDNMVERFVEDMSAECAKRS
jgi:vesicle-fusing ATPase